RGRRAGRVPLRPRAANGRGRRDLAGPVGEGRRERDRDPGDLRGDAGLWRRRDEPGARPGAILPRRPCRIGDGSDDGRPLRADRPRDGRHAAAGVMAMDRVMVGAVVYDPNVVPIWAGIRAYFADAPVGMDFVLFSNYEAQVEALLGDRIDIAWNTNLAYVRTHLATDGVCRVLAMRDTDVEFFSTLVGRAGELAAALDLKGKRLALGSADSAQAAIMPVHYLMHEGL